MRGINRKSKTILLDYINEFGLNSEFGIAARSGSSGKWAKTPFICVIRGKPNGFNKQYSAENGVYPAYLFSDNCSEIYLSFMIGIGYKNEKELKLYVDQIRSDVGKTSFSYDTETMNVGDKGHLYRQATAFFRCYKKGDLITTEMLRNDLLEMILIQMKLGSDYYRNLVIKKN